MLWNQTPSFEHSSEYEGINHMYKKEKKEKDYFHKISAGEAAKRIVFAKLH